MSRFPDVVIIIRSKNNFANIGKVRIIGSAFPCRNTLRVGAPEKMLYSVCSNMGSLLRNRKTSAYFSVFGEWDWHGRLGASKSPLIAESVKHTSSCHFGLAIDCETPENNRIRHLFSRTNKINTWNE